MGQKRMVFKVRLKLPEALGHRIEQMCLDRDTSSEALLAELIQLGEMSLRKEQASHDLSCSGDSGYVYHKP